MSALDKRSATAQIVIGLFVCVVGMLFLVDNLGWVDINFTLHLWPTALIFFGILKAAQTRTRSGAMVGGVLILVGVVILLKETGLISIGWRTLWPVLLIVFGVSVVFKSVKGVSMLEQFGGPFEKPATIRW